MITVHHLESSRSQRVLWLLEELGLEYRVVRYERDRETMLAPAALRKVHPLGKSPVITDRRLTLAESGAIVEYLVERYGEGRLAPPPGSRGRLRYIYWMHYAEGSAMPPLLLKIVFDRVGAAKMPIVAKPVAKAIAERAKAEFIQPQIDRHLDFMNAELARHRWFAGGRFSAADIQMSFPVEAAEAQGDLTRGRGHLAQFLARVRARPAYKRALERGGEYRLGF
jgi:glutathione S-transferase